MSSATAAAAQAQEEIDAEKKKEQKDVRPVLRHGPVISGLLEKMPESMAELMKGFVENRDFNHRAKIRLQMKALLDIVSVDTTYPPIDKSLTDYQREDEEAKRDPVRQNSDLLGGESEATS